MILYFILHRYVGMENIKIADDNKYNEQLAQVLFIITGVFDGSRVSQYKKNNFQLSYNTTSM